MRGRVILFVALIIGSNAISAQQSDAEKFASTITRYDLHKHLAIVAGPEMEGRLTSTPGQQKAAEYIESQFRSLGLTSPPKLNGYQQIYPLFKDTMIRSSLRIGNKNYEFGKDYVSTISASKGGTVKAKKIIFVGYGIADAKYDDYAGKDVKGKIVVYFSGEPQINGKYIFSGTTRPSSWGSSTSTKKAILAKRKGAVGAIMINVASDTFSNARIAAAKKTGLYYPSQQTDGKFNAATVSESVATEIFGASFFTNVAKAEAGESFLTVNNEVSVRTKFEVKKKVEPHPSSNVLGIIEGTDKKGEYIIITAHYDHIGTDGKNIYYGADDDGSGTVAVIEMAEAFMKAKAEGKGPRRTVVFMTVSGEEMGLLGSQYYTENPVYPLNKTSVNLNIDMIGRTDIPYLKDKDSANYLYVIGDDKLSSEMAAITDRANASVKLKVDRRYNDLRDPNRYYFRSDHYNFASKGVPIIFYFNGVHADYHRVGDTVDKINFGMMERRARLVFLTAWEMVNRDGMLKRDIPLEGVIR